MAAYFEDKSVAKQVWVQKQWMAFFHLYYQWKLQNFVIFLQIKKVPLEHSIYSHYRDLLTSHCFSADEITALSKTGVPNVFLILCLFSISKNEHVPKNFFSQKGW